MRTGHPSADIVVGLGWGDEAKGATVDALAAIRPTARVVRFNGGHQAAHNVVVEGAHHTFASYGSASLSGVPTWISHYCSVSPLAALRERDALARLVTPPPLHVDAACLVTTPLHALANRFREAARGSAQHGSTGVGFGETVAYGLDHPASALRAGHLADPTETFERLVLLRDHLTDQGVVDLTRVTDGSLTTLAGELRDTADTVFVVVEHDRLIAELQTGHTVFEGAQGFWLDENFGFQPHTTWSTTTPANARALLREAGIDDVRAVGCIRTYVTRHGAGPLPGEGELAIVPTEPHNNDTDYAGAFRTAAHDPRLLGTAIDLTMVDALAVSHTDVFGTFRTTEGPLPLDAFGPVILVATGPARADRRHT